MLDTYVEERKLQNSAKRHLGHELVEYVVWGGSKIVVIRCLDRMIFGDNPDKPFSDEFVTFVKLMYSEKLTLYIDSPDFKRFKKLFQKEKDFQKKEIRVKFVQYVECFEFHKPLLKQLYGLLFWQ